MTFVIFISGISPANQNASYKYRWELSTFWIC